MRLLEFALVSWFIIAPGVLAESNDAVGQAAFDQCMTATHSGFTCEPIRLSAIRDEASVRFQAFLNAAVTGKIRSVTTLNKYLVQYRLTLVK